MLFWFLTCFWTLLYSLIQSKIYIQVGEGMPNLFSSGLFCWISKKIFLFKVWVYYLHASDRAVQCPKSEKATGSSGTGVIGYVVVSHHVGAGSFARAAGVHNCWAISPSPEIFFFFKKTKHNTNFSLTRKNEAIDQFGSRNLNLLFIAEPWEGEVRYYLHKQIEWKQVLRLKIY